MPAHFVSSVMNSIKSRQAVPGGIVVSNATFKGSNLLFSSTILPLATRKAIINFRLLGGKSVLDLFPCPICRVFFAVDERTSLGELGSLICLELSWIAADASEQGYAQE